MSWVVAWAAAAWAQEHHAIRLLDPEDAPFACATLETVHHVRYTTDADGWVAVYEPGLMNRDVWFTPTGAGLRAPVDWLGLEGFAVTLTEGETTTYRLQRVGPGGACDAGDREQRLLEHGVPTAAEHHELQVVDAATGLPVPAVRLTALGREHWTDNGGRVAFFDLDAMDEDVVFDLWTHGYTHATGSVTIVPAAGGKTTIELDRVNVAERLARLTGGGIWRDSVLLGHAAPLLDPLLDAEVLGQDTAHVVEWRGGLFWLWGDTNKPSYPLGNFNTAGATSTVDATPEDGVDLDYYVDDGFTKAIAPEFDEGPVWLGGLVALTDDELWATYMNVASDFTLLKEGVVRWSDAQGAFVEVLRWGPQDHARPEGPAVRYTGPDGDWVIYRSLHRVAADPFAMGGAAAYESWTPLEPDGAGGFRVARDGAGVPVWTWRNDAPAPNYTSSDEGLIPEEVSPWHAVIEPDTGETPVMHQGTLAWSPYRGRWIHVYTESFGESSLIGEIWYAEGDTPLGPWTWTRKIITHDDYSWYNPYFHPWFATDGGRRVLFEGTYTAWLGTDDVTPRHDYNQQLYALELDDPRLALPVAFYEGPDGPAQARELTEDAVQAFGAWDRPVDGAVAVRWTAPACADRELVLDGPGEVAFWALPPGTTGTDRADLKRWDLPDGTVTWALDAPEGATGGEALAAVWRPRWSPPAPLASFAPPERAHAGPDQCGVAGPVTLDGSASSLEEGITAWTWTWDGGSAEGPAVTVDLPVGVTAVTLTVSGPSGESADVVAVEVVAGGKTPGGTTTGTTEETTPTGSEGPRGAGDGGCGCDAAGVGAGWVWLLGAAAVRRRRR